MGEISGYIICLYLPKSFFKSVNQKIKIMKIIIITVNPGQEKIRVLHFLLQPAYTTIIAYTFHD